MDDNKPSETTPDTSKPGAKGGLKLPSWTSYALAAVAVIVMFVVAGVSSEAPIEHTAAAIRDRDSVPMMTSYGVNTLISDSGIIKYRIVAERWEVNTVRQPSRWIFDKGLFLTQFDEKFHVHGYIQADTAYYYDQKRLWELRSRVRVLNKDGLRFFSEQLFWDEQQHKLYSNVFSRVITPERTLQGTRFWSDEQMTRYNVSNSKGSFERSDMDNSANEKDSARIAQDSIMRAKRRPVNPSRRTTQ